MSDAAYAVRDIVLVREVQRTALAGALRAVAEAWAADWGATPPGAEPAATDPQGPQRDAANWRPALAGSTAAVWTHVTEDAASRLAAGLLQRPAGDGRLPAQDWSVAAAREALDDLQRRVAARFAPAAPKPYADHAQALSDCLAPQGGGLVIGLYAWDVQWLFAPEAHAALAPAPQGAAQLPPLAALTGVLAARKVPAQLGLGEVEVALQDLLALQVGDVVRFAQKLADPLPVTVGAATQETALLAHLGQQQGRLALSVGRRPQK